MRPIQLVLFTACAAVTAVGQVPTVLFYEPFNDNSAGWTLGTDWEIGAAQSSSGQTTGNGDPEIDGSGVLAGGVAGVNIGGNYNGTGYDFRYLTSPTINLGGQSPGTQSILTFRRYLNSDDPFVTFHVLQVFNGASWTTIWFGTSAITDSTWSTQTFDVTAYASSAFAVRWGHNKVSLQAGVMSGWNLDNVQLAALPPTLSDSCASATSLSIGITGGHLYGATPTNPQPTSCDGFTTSTIDRWYSYVSPTGGEIKITRSGGTRMALYTGSDCASLTLVSDLCGTDTTFDNVIVTAGTAYWLRIGGDVDTTHTITVELSASLATIGVGSPSGTFLSSSGPPVLGSVGTLLLDAEPFRFGIMLMAPPNYPNIYTPIGAGTIYLTNSALTILTSYTTDAVGQWSLTVPLPSDPIYTGFAVDLQCVNFGPFTPETSNALRLVMGP